MKRLLRKAVQLLPRGVADRIDALKHRAYWLTKDRKRHEAYFEEYQTRAEVIKVLRDWLDAHPRGKLRVLELGCSGGNNLRLLHELLAIPVQYVGLDIQPAAIAYAKSKFPQDSFIVGDDYKLLELAPQLGRFDVFLVSGVFCLMPQPRSQATLALAARISDLVLVCDDLSRFAASEGANEGLFLHPYARMCREAGLEIVTQPVHARDRSNFSVFMARSQASAVAA